MTIKYYDKVFRANFFRQSRVYQIEFSNYYRYLDTLQLEELWLFDPSFVEKTKISGPELAYETRQATSNHIISSIMYSVVG